MTINLHAVASLISSVLVFLLGLLVFCKHQGSAERLTFSWFCLTAFGWLFGYGFMESAPNPSSALLWARLGHSSVIFIPIAYLHFVRHSLKVHWLTWNYRVYYCIGAVSLLLMWTTDLYIQTVHQYHWGFYPKGGLVMLVNFLLLSGAVLLAYISFVVRWRQVKHSQSLSELNKLRYECVALVIFTFAALDFLPKLTPLEYYPLGFATTVGFVTITTYAILKHRLMDISIAIRKSLVYSVLVAGITLVYLMSVVLTEKFLQGMLGYQGLIATLIAALTIAVGFIPFRNLVQRLIDRAFFHGTQIELAAQREQLLAEVRKGDQMKAVATLAAGMAHEIKNPLTAIKTFTEYLPERFDDPAFREKFTRIIGQEVGKIHALVQQLLDFAKPRPPQTQPTRLAQLLDETLDFLSGDCLKRRIQVVRAYSPYDELLVDPAQMKQVFLNLLLNSIEAMDSQGGRINLSSTAENGHLEVTITDTGPGISKEQLSHVFDPFYTTKPAGTGLGLSVVQSIVREHGGRIAIDSELGHGTTVRIQLPIAQGIEGVRGSSKRGG